ncbi:MAG: polysaccharide biosynthesis tyrosine autokinase [Muribaculaceae bacterium]|nr:polysaccharide biosynthesis tyrosine autokinase [Muribaculaceae bacterium]
MAENTTITQQEEQSFDFGTLFDKYKRYWWLFLLSLLACCCLAFYYLKVTSRVYDVNAVVLVAQEDNSSSAGTNLLKSMKLIGSGGKVEDEMIVFSSQELCTEVARRLKLNRTYTEDRGWLKPKKSHYNSTPVEVVAPEEMFDTLSSIQFKIDVNKQGLANIKARSGKDKLANIKNCELPATIKTTYGTFVVRATEDFKAKKPYHIKASLIGSQYCGQSLNKKIKVKLITKKANGINLSIQETIKGRGRDILNTLIDLYNERGQEEKDEQAINTAKFIDERLALIYKGLTGSEADIEAFRRRNNMINVEMQMKSAMAKQEVTDRAIIKLETNKRLLNMVKEFVSDPANKHSYIPFAVDSSAASGSIKAYNNLLAKRQELEQSAQGDNLALKRIDEQIETMHGNILKGVESSIKGINMQLSQAQSQTNATNSDMGKVPSVEREAQDLYRQQSIQNALYTFLLQKREENSLVLAATTPKGKVVDHAYASIQAIKPVKFKIYFLALLAGLLLPLALLFLKGLFTTKFSTQEDLQNISKAPVVGEICHNRHRSQLVVKEGKSSSIVELFRLLRNNIQFMLPTSDDKVMLVTSSISGEGKSFVSLNLASSFSLMGKRVVLVGMDIRSPKLAQMLNINDTPGVTAFLAKQNVALDDIVQHCPECENLDVIVGGTIPPNPSELLLTTRVEDLIDQLKERYDYVIIDSAPIAMVSDTYSLSRYANVTVYVTRSNYTKRSLVRYMNNAIARRQLRNVAVVLNDSNPKMSQGYGYGYGQDKE